MTRALALTCVLCAAAPAVADEPLPRRFAGVIALGATGVTTPYAGVGTYRSVSPVVIGQWRNVYFAGDRVLVGVHDHGAWSLAFAGQLRHHQLREPDRDKAVELGAVLTVPVGAFRAQLGAYTDVSGVHGGTEIELRAFRDWSFDRITLVPALAVQRQDASLTGRYFGTPDFAPGATINLTRELTAIVTVNEPWVAVASFRLVRHGGRIAASPAVSDRYTSTWTLAFGRRF